MERPSLPHQQSPSSPVDRPGSRHERRSRNERSMSAGSGELEHHSVRRTAHLWSSINSNDDNSSNPTHYSNQPRRDRSFEDFRSVDPVHQLNFSATTNPREVAPRDFAPTSPYQPARASPNTPMAIQEMIDPQGNKYLDIDPAHSAGKADWATPPESVGNPETTATPKSTRHGSGDSVESYHITLQRLNTLGAIDRGRKMGSVARWLNRDKRSKPDPRFAELEKGLERLNGPMVESVPASHNRAPPHISSFGPNEHKSISTRSLSARSGQIKGQSRWDSLAIRSAPPKEQKNGLFGPGRKKSPNLSEPNMPSSPSCMPECEATHEAPFSQLSPLIYESPKSSNRGRTGYFAHLARASEDDDGTTVKGLYESKSRRTEERDKSTSTSNLKVPSPEKPESDFWLKARRPKYHRFTSSSISPCDTSHKLIEQPVYNQWKVALEKKNLPGPPLRFPELIQTPVGMNPNSKIPEPYLPTEDARVITPSHLNATRGNKSIGYFWDSWFPQTGEKDQYYSKEFHTPFPMPNDSTITNSVSVPTGERDWYRVRMDRIMGEADEPKDLDELRMFEWDLPEHLPNSPLCPLSPKHQSRGKGVCVYHGRQRRGGTVGRNPQMSASTMDIGVDLWK